MFVIFSEPVKKRVDVLKTQPDNDELKSVQSIATPSMLVEKMGEMNANQRGAVVDLGFGRLLDLKVMKVPQRLE